jgi:hypothetical protein
MMEPQTTPQDDAFDHLRDIFNRVDQALADPDESRSFAEQLARILAHGPNPPIHPSTYELAAAMQREFVRQIFGG